MAVPHTRRYLLLFSAYYFAAYMPWGVYVPYLPLFFQRAGRSDAEIGALLALPSLLAVLSPPIWGAAGDRLRNKKAVLLITLGVSAFIFPCFWVWRSFPAAMAVMVAFAFFFTPSEPLADAIALESLPHAGGDYGKIRLWGSLGFIFPLLLMGGILRAGSGMAVGVASLAPIFAMFVLFRLLALMWATRLPCADHPHPGAFDWRALRVLAARPVLVLALCAFVGRLGTQGLYVFFSIYLDKLHVGDNIKGYFWALGVISEVLVMYFAGSIMARTSMKWLFTLSLAASAARLFALSFPLSFAAIALVAPLQGIAFAAFHVPAVTYVSRIAPAHLRASAQALYMALIGGLGGVVGAQVSGAVAGAIGVLGLFRAMSFVVAAALVAFVAFFHPETEPCRARVPTRAATDGGPGKSLP